MKPLFLNYRIRKAKAEMDRLAGVLRGIEEEARQMEGSGLDYLPLAALRIKARNALNEAAWKYTALRQHKPGWTPIYAKKVDTNLVETVRLCRDAKELLGMRRAKDGKYDTWANLRKSRQILEGLKAHDEEIPRPSETDVIWYLIDLIRKKEGLDERPRAFAAGSTVIPVPGRDVQEEYRKIIDADLSASLCKTMAVQIHQHIKAIIDSGESDAETLASILTQQMHGAYGINNFKLTINLQIIAAIASIILSEPDGIVEAANILSAKIPGVSPNKILGQILQMQERWVSKS